MNQNIHPRQNGARWELLQLIWLAKLKFTFHHNPLTSHWRMLEILVNISILTLLSISQPVKKMPVREEKKMLSNINILTTQHVRIKVT